MQPLSSAHTTHRWLTLSGFVCLFCILLAAGVKPYVPIEYLIRDPATIAAHPFYFGFFSHVDVLLWMASAVSCLFGAALLNVIHLRPDYMRFLMAFGGLSAILGLDDLFLLHERAIPMIFGIAQPFVFVGYAVMLALCLCRFRKVLLKTLCLSLVLFSVSVLIDVVPLPTISFLTAPPETTLAALFYLLRNGLLENGLLEDGLLEDGAKLLAIFLWFAYFSWTAIILLAEAVKTVPVLSTVEQRKKRSFVSRSTRSLTRQ